MTFAFEEALVDFVATISRKSPIALQHWLCKCADTQSIYEFMPVSEPSYYELLNHIYGLANSVNAKLPVRIAEALCCAISDWNGRQGGQLLGELALVADALQISATIPIILDKFFQLKSGDPHNKYLSDTLINAVQGFPPSAQLAAFGTRLLSSLDHADHHAAAAIMVCEGSPDQIAHVLNHHYGPMVAMQLDAKLFFFRLMNTGVFPNIIAALPQLAVGTLGLIAKDLLDPREDPNFTFQTINEAHAPLYRHQQLAAGFYLVSSPSTTKLFDLKSSYFPLSILSAPGHLSMLEEMSNEQRKHRTSNGHQLTLVPGGRN